MTRTIKALLKTMRPKQWVKNVFLFAALVFDQKLTKWHYVWQAFVGFLLFILISGTVYIINDLIDIEKDRQHPQKSRRPLATGELSPKAAFVTAILLTISSLGLAFWLSPLFTLILSGYLALQLVYSLRLKNVVLLDVLALAMGFVLRVAGGAVLVTAERFSPWLFICMTLGALFLGLGKRRGELVLLGQNAENHRAILKEYNLPFLDQLLSIITSAFILAYSFYTFSAPNLPKNYTMMLTIPFVIYGLFRYLYLIQIKNLTLAPDEVLWTDRPIQITAVMWGIIATSILYLA
ncbi:MAG: decaprenyl-phosphate phosphoribosyltransferase [Anaerolineae bacterium]|nr:decaprenyl-phosphate phosphoribosyltransferase [Anaerolineae bacterium]